MTQLTMLSKSLVLRAATETAAQAALALIEAQSIQEVARVLLATVMRRFGAIAGATLIKTDEDFAPVISCDQSGFEITPDTPKARPPVFPNLPCDLLQSREPLHVVKGSVSVFDDTRTAVTALWAPLFYREEAIGALYLETVSDAAYIQAADIGILSMLVRQAAASLVHLRTSENLKVQSRLRCDAERRRKETYDSMIKHQRIGKMGDFRFNTRTLLSKGSPQCYTMFGYETDTDIVEYDLWMDKLHPSDRQRVHEEMAAAFVKRVPLRFEYRIIKDGETRHILSEGHPEFDENGDLLYCGVVVDITEQKAAEELFANMQSELSTALRLASLGELAGSVVHEVNQPLTAMITNADACKRWLARDPAHLDEAREAADEVVSLGRRAAAVVGGLAALTKGVQIQLCYLNLNDVILEVVNLLRSQIERELIAVRMDLDDSIPWIPGDRTQLQQVVFNLVRNSIDAMKAVHDRPRQLTISSWSTGHEVVVAFRDVGEGVDIDRLERLFDPLFTTKGDGLGLGLSICRKIISAHRGKIWAERNNEAGLTVNFSVGFKQANQQ
jgi:two-component system, LuxR family, sensor kinase FixL